jgi:GntR family transcriptional regulator
MSRRVDESRIGEVTVSHGATGFTPLYVHISRYLRGLILDGDLRMGDAIPSESELVKQFGTTRGTVRSAVDILVNEGLVRRAHGKGTFVQLRPIQHNIWNFGGFTDSLRDRSETAVAKVVSGRALGLEGREYFEVVRLRGIDSGGQTEYLSLDTSWLPLDLFPGIDQADLENRSLYALLRSDYDTHPRRTSMTITTEVPTARTRDLLGEEAGQKALLKAEGSAFDQNGVEIERIQIVYSSRVQFNLTTSIGEPGERAAE